MCRHTVLVCLTVVMIVALLTASGCGGGGRGGGSAERRFDSLPDAPLLMAPQMALRSRWQRTELYYYIHNTSPDFSADSQRSIFRTAMSTWSSVCSLKITEVDSPLRADIVIGFGTASHCELYSSYGIPCPSGSSFDGEGGTIAHAYYPLAVNTDGQCHFDDDEFFADSQSSDRMYLLSVAIHEIGHSLGLDHRQSPDSVMYPSYTGRTRLSREDIAAIQHLYGAKDGSQPPAMPPTPPKTPGQIPSSQRPSADDWDGDKLTNAQEYYLVGTDPFRADTDGDTLIDSEVLVGLNPLNPDTDGDGRDDGRELREGTSPFWPTFAERDEVKQFVGVYSGVDSDGDGFGFAVEPDATAYALLRTILLGYPMDLWMVGGINASGLVVFLSYDYTFVYVGQIVGNVAVGSFETIWGRQGTWYAFRERASSSGRDVVAGRVLARGNFDHKVPTRDEQAVPTHPALRRVRR